jgi:hypothetical protein
MMTAPVRELAAWGLDENACRTASWTAEALWARVDQARALVDSRELYAATCAELAIPESLRRLLDLQLNRPDLHRDVRGLTWRLGLVSLTQLLAFQRRVRPQPQAIPEAGDWAALIELCFDQPRPIEFSLNSHPTHPTIHSENPDLSIRLESSGIYLYGGSPFFEVARYRERYFLRDGYHRAYRLLRGGVDQVPAVIVEATSLAEVGAIGDRFFDEAQMFSAHPPRVADFADERLTLEYPCPPLRKAIRIHIEETFTPIHEPSESQGEQP